MVTTTIDRAPIASTSSDCAIVSCWAQYLPRPVHQPGPVPSRVQQPRITPPVADRHDLSHAGTRVLQCVHAAYPEGVGAPLRVEQLRAHRLQCQPTDALEVVQEHRARHLRGRSFARGAEERADLVQVGWHWVVVDEVFDALFGAFDAGFWKLAWEVQLVAHSLHRV